VPPGERRRDGRAGTRLRRPAEFAAVLAAPRAQSLRAARDWLAMTAAWFQASSPSVRFGATVARRQAHRAIDRALVKRILRDAARAAGPALTEVCARGGIGVDVAFRLKAMRRPGAGVQSTRAWRRALRAEADSLLTQLLNHLTSLAAP
jgi:ribonuclease P protein component